MRRLIQIMCLFLFICSLAADVSYWNAEMVRAYVHNSELQRRWAFSFLAPYLKEMPRDATLLDIGCGEGKITADIAKFIPQGSIVGIDLSTAMLEWARRQYHPLEYPNLSFREGSFLEPGVTGLFDVILSCTAFHHCTEQKRALQQMAKLLKPTGKLLLLTPSTNNKAWSQSRRIVQSKPEWAPYWDKYMPRKFLTVEQYEELLKEAGFRPVKIENIHTMDPFVDVEELLDWFEGTFAPVMPKEIARNYYREWMEEYFRLDPEARDERGVIYIKNGVVGIEAVLADNPAKLMESVQIYD